MKIYHVHTFTTEDSPEMDCGYEYEEYMEVITALENSGKDFTTWIEEV